nr:GspE/PulE family protein [uncultured Draconibacterium sp.]
MEINIRDIRIDTNLRQTISTEMAWQYRVVPKYAENGTLQLYIDQSLQQAKIKNELSIITGKEIYFEELTETELSELLTKYYPRNTQTNENISVKVGAEDFVFQLIKEAKILGSSDIHIEPSAKKSKVRIRIDGQLIERYSIPKEIYPGILNKIKIMSRLDISEKRLPQDGRIFFNRDNHKFDIRVSVLPTLYGEKVVMRILSNDASGLELEKMGFSEIDLYRYEEGIKKPNGIILISGPTGSGKTTTLYATLKKLNTATKNILTIEDPVEYTLEGINQVQLKEDIGLDFTRALKTFLRQDPDIIMVGEIRDVATAQMAIRAALTGHLVLSTIHTNSAWGTVSRLIDMGIPSFMVANTLNLTVAQRLVRLLCNNCKVKQPFNNDILPQSFRTEGIPEYHFTANGCENCFHTGYKGRCAIFEVISIDEELRENIKITNLGIGEYLKNNQVKLIQEQAFDLVKSGKTSVNEVYSLLISD